MANLRVYLIEIKNLKNSNWSSRQTNKANIPNQRRKSGRPRSHGNMKKTKQQKEEELKGGKLGNH